MMRRSGFSVIELLLAAAVFSILVFVIASLRSNVDRLSSIVTQKLQSRQDIDRALEQMVSEIRSASPSSQGAFPVAQASTGTLTIYSDADGDGLFERIRYSVSQGTGPTSTLMRAVTIPTGTPLTYNGATETTSTLVSDVLYATSSPIFSYYGTGYTGTQAPLSPTSTQSDLVRAVQVQLYVDVRPREAPKPVYVSQLITIRNLRDD